MSPEKAKIFLVEDNEFDICDTRWFLKEGGHQIVIEAKSLEEALNLIPSLKEKEINVAIVDGNLSSGERSGSDGARIAEEIRKKAPDVKIVAYSGAKYDYGDVYVSKSFGEEREIKLGEVIKKL